LSAPTPSTTTPGTYKYYVSQTLNFIESPRAEISVIVNPKQTWYKDTDGDGKGDLNDFVISCSQPTGYVKEAATAIATTNAEQNQILVFPQPFKNTFTLKLIGTEKIRMAQIINLAGAMVDTKINIDDSILVMGEKLHSGMYILVVSTEKNTYKLKLSKF